MTDHRREDPGRSPRILYCSTVARFLEAFLLPYGRHFRDQGWQVYAAAQGAQDSEPVREHFDDAFDVPWSRNPHDPRNLAAAREIRSIVRETSPDIIHTHTPVASFVTRLATGPVGPPSDPALVYTAHGFHFHPEGGLLNPVFRTAERLAGRWTDHLVVINDHDEEAARDAGIVDPESLHRIPGVGVDLAEYDPQRVDTSDIEAFRDELGLSTGDPLVCMVAEFNPGKRHRDLVRAAAKLDGVHVAFAGTGPERDAVASLASEMGIRERIHLLGFREDVPRIVRASQALVLPSQREGLPRSVMEALALQTPVVASDVRGNRDLVDEEVGRLYPVGDVDALAEALWTIVDPETDTTEMGRRARRRAERYSLKRVLDQHQELYDAILRDREWTASARST